MAEKVTSMRLNEEDLEQFKAFAKDNGLNQQQAFNSLIALAELEKAKDVLGDRSKSIDTFRDTINRAIGMYVNALEENTTAEQTIREELHRELQTKDNNISNLYEQLQEVKADNETLKSNNKEIDSKLQECMNALVDKSKECINFESQVNTLNSNNDLLQEQLQEYKEYKNNYKSLEKDLEQLKKDIKRKDVVIQGFTTDNQQLKDKINNDSEMIDFYKANNAELKDNIKILENKYDKQIENIKIDHEKEINNLKVEYNDRLGKQSEEITKSLASNHDIEIGKKELEIEKLKNELSALKSKNHKTTQNTK